MLSPLDSSLPVDPDLTQGTSRVPFWPPSMYCLFLRTLRKRRSALWSHTVSKIDPLCARRNVRPPRRSFGLLGSLILIHRPLRPQSTGACDAVPFGQFTTRGGFLVRPRVCGPMSVSHLASECYVWYLRGRFLCTLTELRVHSSCGSPH